MFFKMQTKLNKHIRGLKKSGVTPKFKRLVRFLYRASYITGENALEFGGVIAKGGRAAHDTVVRLLFKCTDSLVRNISEFKRSRIGRGEVSVTRGILNFGASVSNIVSVYKESFERGGLVSAFTVVGRFVRRRATRFFVNKKTAFNYIAPALSIGVLAVTIYFWSNACFGIFVTYDGKNLGVVGSEQTFRDAAAKVEQNVSDASGSNFKLSKQVSYKFVLAKKSDLSDENQMYNNIVMKSCDGVKNGYGLYVDNRLAGVSSENGEIEAMLNSMTEEYKKDSSVQSVSFAQDVAVKSGVYPASVFKTIDEIKNTVTAKDTESLGDMAGESAVTTLRASGLSRISLDPLYAMSLSTDNTLGQQGGAIVTESARPTLSIKIVKTEISNRQIPYKTVKKNSSRLTRGKTRVSVKGVNGTEKVTLAVTYVDGVKTKETVISSTVFKKPVAEEILVGTKKESEGSDVGSEDTSSIISCARSQIGINYVSGGMSRSGFDCSGFTAYVFRKYGISLPHSAAGQSAYGSYVSRSNLRPGDLVFFDTNGGRTSISHVGIYIGGGSFIDASSSRPHCVTIDSINSNYYSKRYVTARRILK